MITPQNHRLGSIKTRFVLVFGAADIVYGLFTG